MRKTMVVVLASCLFVASVSLAAAEEAKTAAQPAAQKMEQTRRLVGEVVSVDAQANTLTVKESVKTGATKELTFTLSDKAKVTLHGKPGKLDGINPGDSVTVKYMKKESGLVAEQIVVAPPKAASHDSSKTTKASTQPAPIKN